jgi:hypothetical protein
MASPTNNWLSPILVTSHTIGQQQQQQQRYNSGQSHEYILSPSRVTSEGVLLEENIGKYDLSLWLLFLLHFWNKLSENNNFDVKTVRKFLILREK